MINDEYLINLSKRVKWLLLICLSDFKLDLFINIPGRISSADV